MTQQASSWITNHGHSNGIPLSLPECSDRFYYSVLPLVFLSDLSFRSAHLLVIYPTINSRSPTMKRGSLQVNNILIYWYNYLSEKINQKFKVDQSCNVILNLSVLEFDYTIKYTNVINKGSYGIATVKRINVSMQCMSYSDVKKCRTEGFYWQNFIQTDNNNIVNLMFLLQILLFEISPNNWQVQKDFNISLHMNN